MKQRLVIPYRQHLPRRRRRKQKRHQRQLSAADDPLHAIEQTAVEVLKARRKWESTTAAIDGLNSRYGRTLVSVGPWTAPPCAEMRRADLSWFGSHRTHSRWQDGGLCRWDGVAHSRAARLASIHQVGGHIITSGPFHERLGWLGQPFYLAVRGERP